MKIKDLVRSSSKIDEQLMFYAPGADVPRHEQRADLRVRHELPDTLVGGRRGGRKRQHTRRVVRTLAVVDCAELREELETQKGRARRS